MVVAQLLLCYLVDLRGLGVCGLECLSTSTSVNCTEVPPPRVCIISPCRVGGREGGRVKGDRVGMKEGGRDRKSENEGRKSKLYIMPQIIL